jgi:hypothetical protein
VVEAAESLWHSFQSRQNLMEVGPATQQGDLGLEQQRRWEMVVKAAGTNKRSTCKAMS